MHSTYVVVGAGPSGLACALRLAQTGEKVVLCESHKKVGGLNSYYSRVYTHNEHAQKVIIDSGLHAITNFTESKDKKLIFNRLLRSLKMRKDFFTFLPQCGSQIKVKNKILNFTNNINDLSQSIKLNYSSEFNAWLTFLNFVENYNEFDPNQPSYLSARSELKKFFCSDDFLDHILFPVLTYGSAWENDMDYNLFICLFRSMFLEGLCRIEGGITALWEPIINKLKELNVTILLGEKVHSIISDENKLLVSTNNYKINCEKVFSSAGIEITQSLLGHECSEIKKHRSKLAFCEMFLIVEGDLSIEHQLPSIGFYSNEVGSIYSASNSVFNDSLAIYCFPSRFKGIKSSLVSQIRMTVKTKSSSWFNFESSDYKDQKEKLSEFLIKKLYSDFPFLNNYKILFKDLFTPKTIHRYTGSPEGAIYGSKLKVKNARTDVKGVYLIGADQGFPGIVGAMSSGITMANIYGIMASEEYKESIL